MPESVDRPAPVRTTSRRPRSRAKAWSAGIPDLGAGASLGRLDLAVLRRSGGDELLEQVAGGVGDLGYGAVERGLVGGGRLGRPGHLAHELERRRGHLVLGRGRLEVVERADVATHAASVRRCAGCTTGPGPPDPSGSL